MYTTQGKSDDNSKKNLIAILSFNYALTNCISCSNFDCEKTEKHLWRLKRLKDDKN